VRDEETSSNSIRGIRLIRELRKHHRESAARIERELRTSSGLRDTPPLHVTERTSSFHCRDLPA